MPKPQRVTYDDKALYTYLRTRGVALRGVTENSLSVLWELIAELAEQEMVNGRTAHIHLGSLGKLSVSHRKGKRIKAEGHVPVDTADRVLVRLIPSKRLRARTR